MIGKARNRRSVFCFATLLLLGLTGCRSASRSEIIGVWEMTAGSRRELPPEVQKANGKFVFNRDGSFACADVPALFDNARAANGRGTWRLIKLDGNQAVQLTFKAVNHWTRPLPYGMQLFVTRKRLMYFIGDPDEGRAVEFEKKR